MIVTRKADHMPGTYLRQELRKYFGVQNMEDNLIERTQWLNGYEITIKTPDNRHLTYPTPDGTVDFDKFVRWFMLVVL